jgi:hypothetical protein
LKQARPQRATLHPLSSPSAVSTAASAPSPESALLERAHALANVGRVQEAFELLERHKLERSPEAAMLSGILAMSLGEPERAAALFRECAYWDPTMPHCHEWFALAQAACTKARGRST